MERSVVKDCAATWTPTLSFFLNGHEDCFIMDIRIIEYFRS